MIDYPLVDYPTIVEGLVCADKLRLECLDGSEMIIDKLDVLPPSVRLPYVNGSFVLGNFGPLSINGKLWGVSHQQKFSTYGWLKVSPDCYHRWWFWRLQKQDAKGDWIPGTEQGLYFRKPFSWRWDVAGTNGKHWIWTRGFLGGHWD